VSMKATLVELRKYVEHLKLVKAESTEIKRFSSYLLAMLTYLRQGLVCPIIPIASVALDMADFTDTKSELAKMLTDKLDELELTEWLESETSAKSSRIRKVLQTLKEHSDERVVLFFCFRSCLDVCRTYMPKNRPHFTISGNMSIPRRTAILEAYRESENGVLLLTYQIGGEGLNLQFVSTMFLVDYWWNAGMTKQAIARLVRLGQSASTVNVYFFSSNTGVENAVLKKHKSKLQIIEELMVGKQMTRVATMKMIEIVKLIEASENRDLLEEIYIKKADDEQSEEEEEDEQSEGDEEDDE
jgi:SNF2 family DNA or RNA helicase